MIEVEVTNYQSIAHAKFVIDGFTTLVGRNSLGKSAALRAVNAALTNQQGMDFIRWGERFCEVHLKMEDLEILWHKEENNNYYEINKKEVYDKIGKDDPPKKILDAGFKQLKISGQKINLNYADQFNPLFLVDKMDSKGADLLTSVYGLDRLYKAIDLCNKEQRENKDELRMREKDLDLVDKDLERFKNFSSIKKATESLHENKTVIDGSEKSLQSIREKYIKIQELINVCKKMQGIKTVTLPDPHDIGKNIADYKRLIQYSESVDKLSGSIKKIGKIFDITLPAGNAVAISSVIEEYKKLFIWYQRYSQLLKEVDKLSRVNDIVLPRADIDVQSLSRLRTYAAEAGRQKKDLISMKNELDGVIKDREELQTKKSQYKICPLCGGSLNK
jgi:DNA repair ATPase RecN